MVGVSGNGRRIEGWMGVGVCERGGEGIRCIRVDWG